LQKKSDCGSNELFTAKPILEEEIAEKKGEQLKQYQLYHAFSILDVNMDGEVNFVEVFVMAVMMIFLGIYIWSTFIFLNQILLILIGTDTQKSSISMFVSPLAEVSGTLVTIVYSVAFTNKADESATRAVQPETLSFFDFDKDGKVGLVDSFCCFVGSLHALVMTISYLLWMYDRVPVSELVQLVSCSSRLILLFVTKSHLTGPEFYHYKQKSADSTIKTRFLRVVDINKDGIFQFVDLLAAICIIIFCLSASYCWGHFVIFSQIGLSDVNCLIELTKSFNIILLGTFAAVYLSKRSMSPSLERNLGLFSLILLVILVRTVAETMMLPGFQTYKFFMKLAKGLVKGITQLMLGMYILRGNHKSNAANTAC
jgi:uncharacterized membrane protein YgdD (TMEM256/DUF423 family)